MATFATNAVIAINGYPVIDGNFARTSTIVGRAVTLLMMRKGKWPGKNPGDPDQGNTVWDEFENSNESADTIEGVKRGHEQALDPLFREGSLASVRVTDEMQAIGGKLQRVFIISTRSSVGADPEDIVLRAPWLLNV